jgi:hypothetical protein
LVTNEHQRTLIHPNNFSQRFTDGIVQASLLRAALRSELDYEIDQHLEADATSLLEEIFSHPKEQEGEAATEFLLALCMKRIRLSPTAIEQIRLIAETCFDNPATVEYHFARHIPVEY